jgi:hypothetical protein
MESSPVWLGKYYSLFGIVLPEYWDLKTITTYGNADLFGFVVPAKAGTTKPNKSAFP